MLFFLDADAAYARWVARHPDGYVVDVRSRARGAVQALHRARCPDLAPTPAAADGAPTGPRHRPRAGATDRAELEAWADWEGYALVYCRGCGCEAAWRAAQFGSATPPEAAVPGPA
jgi:hypothetical protein